MGRLDSVETKDSASVTQSAPSVEVPTVGTEIEPDCLDRSTRDGPFAIAVRDVDNTASHDGGLDRSSYAGTHLGKLLRVADSLSQFLDAAACVGGETIEQQLSASVCVECVGHIWSGDRNRHEQGGDLGRRQSDDNPSGGVETDHPTASTLLAHQWCTGLAQAREISLDGAGRHLEAFGESARTHRVSTRLTDDLGDREQPFQSIHTTSKPVLIRIFKKSDKVRHSAVGRVAYPLGMTTVSFGYAIFYVDDVGETLRFFENAFEMKTQLEFPENDYGELETGATTLAFVSIGLANSNLEAAGGFRVPGGGQPCAASVTLVTDQVEDAVAKAVAAGARSYVDPVEKPWGQTVAYVLGPSDLLIELATPVSQS